MRVENENSSHQLPLNLVIIRSVQGIVIVMSLMIIFSIIGRSFIHNHADLEREESISIFYGSIIVLPLCSFVTIFALCKYPRDKLVCLQNPVVGVFFGLVLLFAIMLLIALVGHYVYRSSPYSTLYVYEEMMLGFLVLFGFWITLVCVCLFVRDLCYSRERPCGRRWFLVRFQALFLCLATTMPCFCCLPRPPDEEEGIDIMDIDFNAMENGQDQQVQDINNAPAVAPVENEDIFGDEAKADAHDELELNVTALAVDAV